MKSAKLHRIKRAFFCLLLILAMLSAFYGCQFASFTDSKDKGDGSKPPVTGGDGQSTPEDKEPQKPLFYNRYTGLTCDEAISSCRPLSICVGNFDGKTQEGLSFADILIETPIDTDETRFWALTTDWHSVTKMQNVSSAVSYMFPMANAFGAICAYNGGNLGALPTVPTLDYAMGGLTNHFTPSFDGSLSTTGEAMINAAVTKQYSTQDTGIALPYRLAELNTPYVPSGNRISSVHFAFSSKNTVDFAYDEESGTYLRSQKGALHTDVGGTPLSFTNVLILFYNVSYYHTAGGTTYTLDTAAGGSGFCYTGGSSVRVEWKYDNTGNLVFTDDAGEPIVLNRGKTYIGLMKITDSITVVAK